MPKLRGKTYLGPTRQLRYSIPPKLAAAAAAAFEDWIREQNISERERERAKTQFYYYNYSQLKSCKERGSLASQPASCCTVEQQVAANISSSHVGTSSML